MLSIGLRGRFGNYDHCKLSLARQKQDFGSILTRARTTSPDETSDPLLSADQLQDRGSTNQIALELRQTSIPLSRIDSSGSPSRQETSSSADLSGIDRTRELVRLILDTDDIKRNLVASEFLQLTDSEFQDILDEATVILRDKKISYDRASGSTIAKVSVGMIAAFGILLPILHVVRMQGTYTYLTSNEETDHILMAALHYLALALTSLVIIHLSGCIHAYEALASREKKIDALASRDKKIDALVSTSEKIRKLRNQFQEFCASIRESGLRRVCCTDTPCSISKESITRFFAYAGLAGLAVGLVVTAPYLDAFNSSDECTHFENARWKNASTFLPQQIHSATWLVNFSATYVCNLAVPLVFMANVFSGLKQDVVELFGGARYRNERVQDTVHNLRALFARLLQDDNFERFAEDLMHQKHIGSPELMLMDYVSKIELDANALEVGGVTQDILDQHGLERTDLAVFCSEAKQIMDALPDREIDPAEALELINDLRFDVSFRNKVLSGLKFEDARYSDGWVRFTGGARTLARLGLGWLGMNTFLGTFSSNMIVRHYRYEAGIARNATLSCELFANKTITPFNAARFHMGIASSAAQGIALSNAAMSTLDTGWIMLMMGITTGTRALSRPRTTTAAGKVREYSYNIKRQIPGIILGLTGATAYVYSLGLSCQNSDDVVRLRECPHLSDMPDSPITFGHPGSCHAHMAYMAAVLPLPLINDWDHLVYRTRLFSFRPVSDENTSSNTKREVQSRQEDVEQQQETELQTVATHASSGSLLPPEPLTDTSVLSGSV